MKEQLNIIILSQQAEAAKLSSDFKQLGYLVNICQHLEQLDSFLKQTKVDIVLAEAEMLGTDFWSKVEKLNDEGWHIIPIIYNQEYSSDLCAKIFDQGGYDYVFLPFSENAIELCCHRALKRFEIEVARKDAMQKRLQRLEEFKKEAFGLLTDIRELKREVNALLLEQKQLPKYKI